jgi:DNA-binding MarR family transcriptional regulator
MDTTEPLKLSNQLCFPIYSVSRLLTKAYKPYLEKIGITYPQYLVLLVLWEQNGISVNTISERLLLNTNTLSPLLKRMEKQEFIQRNRSKHDERSVIIQLTQKGVKLKSQAVNIPENLLGVLLTDKVKLPEVIHLKEVLEEWIQVLSHKTQESK